MRKQYPSESTGIGHAFSQTLSAAIRQHPLRFGRNEDRSNQVSVCMRDDRDVHAMQQS